MGKKIDLTKSVFELVNEYPELKDVMLDLGFSEIAKPAMLHSVGRIMTIPRGSDMKKIPMDKIIAVLGENGFEVENMGPAARKEAAAESTAAKSPKSAANEEAAAESTAAEFASGRNTNSTAGQETAASDTAKLSNTKSGDTNLSNANLDTAKLDSAKPGADERNAMLKNYLKRLNQGDDLEAVRADFAAVFADVDPSEIMKAEQELIAEGTPLHEVQQLCDVHSALFHGATREEKIANAEKAAMDSMHKRKEALRTHYDEKLAKTEAEIQAAAEKQQKLHESVPKDKYDARQSVYAELADIPGHPINTYVRENEALTKLIAGTREKLAAGEDAGEDLREMRQLSIHYASKGDLIYPVLDARYDITGPSNVMWTVDDEIRDEMGSLEKNDDHNAEWKERLEAVMTRAEEMVYKEENILFPICAANFTPEEWKGIYRDSMDYALCFGVDRAVWAEAEAEKAAGTGIYALGVGADVNIAAGAASGKTGIGTAASGDAAGKAANGTAASGAASAKADNGNAAAEVVLPGGHMSLDQLRALLNTIPGEITFVDDQNINRFFNEGPKVFKRPGMAIDREVWTCHPPKVEPMVRAIIDDFRNNRRDEVPVWMEKGGRSMLVRYMAVRDTDGNYAGTLEFVQDMEFAKEHFSSCSSGC